MSRPVTYADLVLAMRGSGLQQIYCGACSSRASYSLIRDRFHCRGCDNHVNGKEILAGFRAETGADDVRGPPLAFRLGAPEPGLG